MSHIPGESLKEGVKQNRDFKRLAREEGVRLTGASKPDVQAIQLEGRSVKEKLKAHYSEWLARQKDKLLAYTKDIPAETLEASFDRGFDLLIKQYFRLFQKLEKRRTVEAIPSDQFSEQQLRQLLRVFTFDFVMALRRAERQGLNATTGLALAERSYRLNPDTFSRLRQQYPEFEDWVLSSTLTTQSDPETFLQEAYGRFNELKGEFPELGTGVIVRSVIAYPNRSREQLETIRQDIASLHTLFPDVDHWVITQVATRRKEPKKYLEQLQVEATALNQNFPHIPLRTVMSTLFSHPTEASLILEKATTAAPHLQEAFPDLPTWMIWEALIRHTKNPTEYLQEKEGEIADLSAAFPEMPRALIIAAAVKYADPVAFLNKKTAEVSLRQTEFAHVPHPLIIQAVAAHADSYATLQKADLRHQQNWPTKNTDRPFFP